MATTNSTIAPDRSAFYIWERQARPAIEAIAADTGPVRALIVGNAGSGKSTTLRELQRLLSARGLESASVGEAIDIARIPGDHVLIVDDLHRVSPEHARLIHARAVDPAAGLIVACRPWPLTEEHAAITHALEWSRPAIVLGQVSRSDVLTYIDESRQTIAAACIDRILELTGGVSWLAAESLALHDDRDCANDPSHHAMARTVQERVIHRLDAVPPALREEIVTLCTTAARSVRATPGQEALIAHAHAEGLLLRNGRPVPIVRLAIQANVPATGNAAYRGWIGEVADGQRGATLVAQADLLLEHDPAQAAELYAAAVECGIPPAELAGRRAQAAWASDDVDSANAILDGISLLDGVRDGDRIADTSAAIWSSRGMMRMSDAVYRSLPPVGAESCARATIVALGIGDTATLGAPEAGHGLPSTLGVAMELLDHGLRASLRSDGGEAAVADLVRASEMYTASNTTMPVAELPAVIAAIVAANVGEIEIAHTTIEDAIAGGQGGVAARRRLLLWRSWLAVQRARPADARQALTEAMASSTSTSAREAMLAHAVRVAIARRYEDSAALEAVWAEARDSVLRTEADLYTLLPLTELAAAAARLDDTARVLPHFTGALEIVERLGSPPVWAAHLHWSGIQQGILRNRPDDLKPHARILVNAAEHSAVAAVMAQAGRVWTATLAGSVDADAVEAAAHGLASAGLTWDGARLAGHGASRSTDRKVSARLLSCARELHPNDGARPSSASAAETPSADDRAGTGFVLSERELDVARLVLQGKTYVEIGQTIFISPRTAEHHIAHIRRRIGATSRSDLVAKLRVVVAQSMHGDEEKSIEEGPST